MSRSMRECLSLNFACADSIAEGKVVEIVDDLTVAVPTTAASINVVGTVIRKKGFLPSNAGNVYGANRQSVTGGAPAECTVETGFRERRDDRVAGEFLSVGPFVFGSDGKAYKFTQALPATISGTATGAKTYASATTTENNQVALSYESGPTQTFTIPAGAKTMAQVAALLVGTGFVASVDGSGHLVLTGNDNNKDLEVKAVTGDAYTLLGLTIGVTHGTSDAPAVITGSTTGSKTYYDTTQTENDKVKVTVGSGSDQTFTITAGSKTMQQAADIINATATDFVASVNSAGKITFTAVNDTDSIVVKAVANDAYTNLGFTAPATAAATAADYDPAAIRGIAITTPTAAINATITARATGSITFVDSGADQNNKLLIQIGTAEAQTFTLTAGAKTQSQIATAITNASPVGFTVAVSESGHLVFTCTTSATIHIEAITGSAYRVLGIRVGAYAQTPANMTIQTLEY